MYSFLYTPLHKQLTGDRKKPVNINTLTSHFWENHLTEQLNNPTFIYYKKGRLDKTFDRIIKCRSSRCNMMCLQFSYFPFLLRNHIRSFSFCKVSFEIFCSRFVSCRELQYFLSLYLYVSSLFLFTGI